jgi:hypothetical protein
MTENDHELLCVSGVLPLSLQVKVAMWLPGAKSVLKSHLAVVTEPVFDVVAAGAVAPSI